MCLNIKMFGLKLKKLFVSLFHPVEVVGRGSFRAGKMYIVQKTLSGFKFKFYNLLIFLPCNLYSAVIDFRRQTLTSVDVRF